MTKQQIAFTKYQGAGNDFVVIDDRMDHFPVANNALIEQLCNRKFGIGADGLMLLQNSANHDFKMIYFNADGNESTMCGNGGRCITHFAHSLLQKPSKSYNFIAIDGPHTGQIRLDELVAISMIDVYDIDDSGGVYVLNTGSPHYVQFVDDLDKIDVPKEGRRIRNMGKFKSAGINVNFAEIISNNEVSIRTYERGVEDETLACGTGVTAVGIALYHDGRCNNLDENEVLCHARGGDITVTFNSSKTSHTNVVLIGPAEPVFTGQLSI